MSSRIAVVGTGYVGLTTGACLSHLGHDVVCLDVDEEKVQALQGGHVPILEDGLDRLVVEGLHTDKLSFTTDVTRAIPGREFVFLCLPTPQAEDGSADLSYVEKACSQITDHLDSGAVVINKSTVPVGTTALVAAALGRYDIHVVSNPEFLRQGTAVHDFLNPDRIVIGADDRDVALRVASLYLDLAAPWVVTDPASSELIKYVANSFLATKLSFVNSVAAVAEAVGADVEDVIQGVGHDRRIGHAFLQPGPGWGGSCLPKDTSALAHIAESAGYEFGLLRSAMEVNVAQFERVVAKVEDLVGDLKGKRIAVWGLTFKANTDDLRDSPALKIVSLLLKRGAEVRAYDPGIDPGRSVMDGLLVVPEMFDATEGADALVVLTEWSQFRRADVERLQESLARSNVVDARNLLDLDALARRGFAVRSIGRR
ncbi:MAG: UDP-glucose/GDP-mannose dehydrogenase family protein [Microthrixaceae bacterium]|nr:UDP-glucose/GDP-mannose dehydrogenase family protein [Microthrixaceae bacterium]